MDLERDYQWYVESFRELDEQHANHDSLLDFVRDRVFRSSFHNPGFARVTLASEIHGIGLRMAMEAMVRGLSRRNGDDPLTMQWAQRFDQQTTTRFHRDNGPDESYLLLGYEPSPVESDLAMADYSRAAFDLDISPSEFLDRYNPMFAANAERIVPYVTRLTRPAPGTAQLLIINNSRLPSDAGGRNRLGVLHQATIAAPIAGAQRVIHSVQLAPASLASEKVSRAEWEHFLRTDEISAT